MTDPDPTARMPLPEESSAVPSTPVAPPAAPSTPVAPAGPSAVGGPSTVPPGSGGWRPAREDDRRMGSLVFGLLLLGVGLWFFAEHTLGLPMPDVSWGRLWPLILVGLGLWVVFSSVRRGPR